MCLAAAATWMAASGVAFAQQDTTSTTLPVPPPAGVSLVSQTPWVRLHSTFTLTLHLDDLGLAAQPGAAIGVLVHESAISRSAFDDAVGGRDLGGVVYQPSPIPLASLHPNANHNVLVTFGLPGSGVTPSLGVRQPGVFPVQVSLTNTGRPTGSFVTWLVTVGASPTPVDQKLSVAMLFQAVADPSTQALGAPTTDVATQVKPGGRLDKIASVLDRGQLPFSLIVSPETAQQWQTLATHDPTAATGLNHLVRAAHRASTELLPAPYVPLDASAALDAGFGGALGNEYRQGASVLRTTIGTSPVQPVRSAFIDPASDAAVDFFRQQGAANVAVRDDALVPVTHPFTPAQTFVLDAGGGKSLSATSAPFVETLLTGSGPAALKAQRVVAALAEVAYEEPAIARGLVIAPDARWNPDVATMTQLLAALRDSPLVQPVTLDQFFQTVSREQVNGFDRERQLASTLPAAMPIDLSDYQHAATELRSFRAMAGASDPNVALAEHALLVAASTNLTSDEAHAELSSIDSAVQAFTGSVTTDAKRVTLTARQAKVPLSFVNSLKPPRTIEVRVHLESPKLLFPGGSDQLVKLKPGNNTLSFPVEARASGTFPMTITVTSPDGALNFGAPVRVTVRSAVFGGFAVALAIGALVFLALWWVNHVRRTRKNRRGTPTPVPAT